MEENDFFGKLDDILYAPVRTICNYIEEPLNALHAKRDRVNEQHTANIQMQMREHEEMLRRESAREAAELDMEMRRLHAEMDAVIAEQEDARRDRLVESIKRYQIELATASRDIVNSIGVMSLELRERANDMVRENTEKYKQMQSDAMKEADDRLALIAERYANNERIRIRMEDSVMAQMDSIIDTASKFISELAEDIKRMNANTDELMRLQMENVNAYLKPMTGALQVGTDNDTTFGQIDYSDDTDGYIDTEISLKK